MTTRSINRLGACAVGLVCFASSLRAQVLDDFDDDPRDNPDWEFYEPLAPVSTFTEDGFFRVTLPTGIALDTWTTVDNGVQVRRSDFPEDFVIETRVRIVGSGDPDFPIFPPTDGNYLANLLVGFSQFDLFHWGPQRGTNLANQRVGNTVPRCDEASVFDEVSLQVRKSGTSYTFSWRPFDDEPWIETCTRTVLEPPTHVGLIFKTWGAGLIEEQSFAFDYFRIDLNPAPRISNLVPDPGNNFHPASDGLSFEATAVAAGATIETDGVELTLSGVDVSGALEIGGEPAMRTVRYADLEDNRAYEAEIRVTDSEGNFSNVSLTFGTFTTGGEDFVEEFDDDITPESGWEWYEPLTPIAWLVDDGVLRATLPVGINMDHWTTADRATMLRRSGLPEDFVVETRMRILGSGDPDAPILPPIEENYLANLIVQFSQFDLFHWGPQRGTNLASQRVGNTVPRCDAASTLDAVSLMIRKVGVEYTFGYRAEDSDPWTELCTRTAVEQPIFVGLMFKTWQNLSTEQTFEFEYVRITEPELLAPAIALSCEPGDGDEAHVGMPWSRGLEVSGFPAPDVVVDEGPAGLFYNAASGRLEGWLPSSADGDSVHIVVRASSLEGESTVETDVAVLPVALVHDDEFDDDPRDSEDWTFWEPQPGIAYSISEDGWWRLDVPQLGDFGASFDHWVTVDNAPQLRREISGDHWVIETRVRLDPAFAPPANDEFLAGLMVWFSDFDLIHWNIGQERRDGLATVNLFLERVGQNNLAFGRVDGILAGEIVDLRLERACDDYLAFYKPAAVDEWTLAGVYSTPDEPLQVGLIVKTWADGATFSAEFDSFDVVSDPPNVSVEDCANGVDDDRDGDTDCDDEDCAGDGACPEGVAFIRGDTNDDGARNLSDPVHILGVLFLGEGVLSCRAAADTNVDGQLNLSDAVNELDFLFRGLGTLPPPAACGEEPLADPADCESYPFCEG